MFGRCHQRPRPFCATAMPHQVPVIPVGGACLVSKNPQPQVVVEPPVVAAPNVFHHHQNVQHIQPVITQDVHHYHTHHEYVVQEQKKADEVLNHAHGLCQKPVTQPPLPCHSAPRPMTTCR